MAKRSRSIGDEISSFKLCHNGMKNNISDFLFLKAELKAFEADIPKLERENAKQEKLKADLKAQTENVKSLQKDLRKRYSSLIRYAKARYGPNAAKIREFVSVDEGKIR